MEQGLFDNSQICEIMNERLKDHLNFLTLTFHIKSVIIKYVILPWFNGPVYEI